MDPVGGLHERYVAGRRVGVLSRHLAELLPPGARVLDVGCGDGRVDRAVRERRPDVTVDGVDVLVRPATHIPVRAFDGLRLPAGDASYDVVLFVDVLHHASDPRRLLVDAARVARRGVLVKDHFREGFLAGPVLRLMDWVGNARHGVSLRGEYWAPDQWRTAFGEAGLVPTQLRRRLGLYPWPADLLFERRLHFVAYLEPAKAPPG
ncbi:MAG TPA: class I SAM-dependent methyltransferase [Vicinamibacteria bacterium]|nr:class I SAM-dependent methyltransferase [Vicinamibacteria bacterium]